MEQTGAGLQLSVATAVTPTATNLWLGDQRVLGLVLIEVMTGDVASGAQVPCAPAEPAAPAMRATPSAIERVSRERMDMWITPVQRGL